MMTPTTARRSFTDEFNTKRCSSTPTSRSRKRSAASPRSKNRVIWNLTAFSALKFSHPTLKIALASMFQRNFLKVRKGFCGVFPITFLVNISGKAAIADILCGDPFVRRGKPHGQRRDQRVLLGVAQFGGGREQGHMTGRIKPLVTVSSVFWRRFPDQRFAG